MLGLAMLAGLAGADVPMAQACGIVWAAFPWGASYKISEADACSQVVGGLYQDGFVLRNDAGGIGTVNGILARAGSLTPAQQNKINENREALDGVLAKLSGQGYSFYKESRSSSPAAVAQVIQTMATPAQTYFTPAPAPQPMGPPAPTAADRSGSSTPVTMWESFASAASNIAVGAASAKQQKAQAKLLAKPPRGFARGLYTSGSGSNVVTYAAIGFGLIAVGSIAWLLLRKRQ